MATDTALVIIDMQRDFLDPAGYIARSGVDVSPLRVIIPEVRRLLMAARRSGVRVVHTREGHRPDLSDLSTKSNGAFDRSIRCSRPRSPRHSQGPAAKA